MPRSEPHNLSSRLFKKLLLMRRISADARLPRRVKFIPGLIAAYLLSPIDLVPDFIPVLGYLDDLLVVGLLLRLFFQLVPDDLIAHHRSILEAEPEQKAGLRELFK